MSSSPSVAAAPRRDPARVMRLARLGSMHPSRLSFAPTLVRRLARDGWRVRRTAWALDDAGLGHAIYRAEGPERGYALVVLARPDEVAFALVDGHAGADDVARLDAALAPAGDGRLSAREPCLIRGKVSARRRDALVAPLAAGRQPSAATVAATGYVVRTLSVHASGKLGSTDRDAIVDRPEFAGPYQVEMLTLYLARAFSLDLVDHLAARRAPANAATLAPGHRRGLGIGNATGPGLASFFINHPLVTDRWFALREEALARVRALEGVSGAAQALFDARLAAARAHVAQWPSEHPLQRRKIDDLARDLDAVAAHVAGDGLSAPRPWDALWRWGETALSLEGQEMLASLVLEPHGDVVDELAPAMSVDEGEARRLDGRMRVGELRDLLQRAYGWAFAIDFDDPDARARLWYAEATTGEARIGARADLDPAVERPLAPARDAQALARALEAVDDATTVAEFVLRRPEQRGTVRRVQVAGRHAFAEIRDNTLDADLVPLDLLRAKLAFIGATRFDPTSDRRLRVTLFQGAPLADELGSADGDGWIFATPTASPA